VGSRSFVEKVKDALGFRAKGKAFIKGAAGYQVREGSAPYNALFEAEKVDIGPENTRSWEVNPEFRHMAWPDPSATVGE
jgi:hypothetical protein